MGSVVKDLALLKCKTYEDYLDSFIKNNDIRLLRNITCCRQLVVLGHRSRFEILSEKKFNQRKALAYKFLHPSKVSHLPFSTGIDIDDPVIYQMAIREKANTDKIISTILFYKSYNKGGFEISSYIDFEHSLRNKISNVAGSRNWKAIFQGTEMLRPKTTDLSYYNSHKGKVVVNDTNNYKVFHDVENGVIFMYKGDRKIICPQMMKKSYCETCNSSMHFSELYGYMVFYDHAIRKKV